MKYKQHSRIISLFTVLNSFIKNRTTTKSNDLKELLAKYNVLVHIQQTSINQSVNQEFLKWPK